MVAEHETLRPKCSRFRPMWQGASTDGPVSKSIFELARIRLAIIKRSDSSLSEEDVSIDSGRALVRQMLELGADRLRRPQNRPSQAVVLRLMAPFCKKQLFNVFR